MIPPREIPFRLLVQLAALKPTLPSTCTTAPMRTHRPADPSSDRKASLQKWIDRLGLGVRS